LQDANGEEGKEEGNKGCLLVRVKVKTHRKRRGTKKLWRKKSQIILEPNQLPDIISGEEKYNNPLDRDSPVYIANLSVPLTRIFSDIQDDCDP